MNESGSSGRRPTCRKIHSGFSLTHFRSTNLTNASGFHNFGYSDFLTSLLKRAGRLANHTPQVYDTCTQSCRHMYCFFTVRVGQLFSTAPGAAIEERVSFAWCHVTCWLSSKVERRKEHGKLNHGQSPTKIINHGLHLLNSESFSLSTLSLSNYGLNFAKASQKQ